MTRSVRLTLMACLAFAVTSAACSDAGAPGAARDAGGGALGDRARITNSGTSWWVNLHKASVFVSVRMGESYDDDAAGREEAIAYARAVAGKITAATTDVLTCAPAENEVTGWAYDREVTTPDGTAVTAPQVATTKQGAVDLVNGGADPFYVGASQPTAFGWANYVKGPYRLNLYVIKMPSAAAASQLYTDLLQNSLYKVNTWTEL